MLCTSANLLGHTLCVAFCLSVFLINYNSALCALVGRAACKTRSRCVAWVDGMNFGRSSYWLLSAIALLVYENMFAAGHMLHPGWRAGAKEQSCAEIVGHDKKNAPQR